MDVYRRQVETQRQRWWRNRCNWSNWFYWVYWSVGGWHNTQTIISGATYTPSSADVGKLIQLTNTSPINITINTGLGLTAGQSIDFLRYGTGTVTFNGTAVPVATPGLKIRDRYSVATLFCLSTDTYVLMGDLSA